ncbi:MAG TPA: hypothetical protein VLF39_01950 [Candidatus Saccharimonadales bacterium]|nr:hypothetical protein [Candidatus Saccharimonadales bacterium]
MTSPESTNSFELNERELLDQTFGEMGRKIADYYEVPKITERGEITYSFMPSTRDARSRAFPIRSIDDKSYNFVLNVHDYQFFSDEFTAYMGDSVELQARGLNQLGRVMFIGTGIAQRVVEQDTKRKAEQSPRKIKELHEKFTNHDDIDELFMELFPQTADEIDPMWEQTKHIGDQDAIKINAIRASLEYLYNVLDAESGEGLHSEVVSQSRATLQGMMAYNRGQYLDIGMFGFDRDLEDCNKVFMETIPEWLVAMALPFDTEFLRRK